MDSEDKIADLALEKIREWNNSLDEKIKFDIDKSKWSWDKDNNVAYGRFLKFHIYIQNQNGKWEKIWTQTIHEYSVEELEPDEKTLKRAEAMIDLKESTSVPRLPPVPRKGIEIIYFIFPQWSYKICPYKVRNA